MAQALTDSDDATEADRACASRWISCSIRLSDEVAELGANDVDVVEAAGVVSVTFDPSA